MKPDLKVVDGRSASRPLDHLTTEAERHARVLVVDDDVANLTLVLRILARAGFTSVHGVAQTDQIMPAVRAFDPDVVVLDLHMPGAVGIDLISRISEAAGRRNYLPVLVLTGDSSGQSRDAALAAGARDFLTKPYQATEVVLRVRNLIETRMLYVELQRQNALLTERFVARTEELEAAKLEILDRLARASDIRDEFTHAHTFRVGELAARIGRHLGMADQEVEQLRIAARLHDIGKIGVSDTILLKPGSLAPAEFLEQEKHTLIGADLLSGSRFPVLKMAEDIALTHHENWDGNGYPRGLAGTDIPLVGRIVAVADVFDALTHERPYKRAWTRRAAFAEIRARSGSKFDPAVVAAFAAVFTELPEIEVKGDLEPAPSGADSNRPRIVRDVIRRTTLG